MIYCRAAEDIAQYNEIQYISCYTLWALHSYAPSSQQQQKQCKNKRHMSSANTRFNFNTQHPSTLTIKGSHYMVVISLSGGLQILVDLLNIGTCGFDIQGEGAMASLGKLLDTGSASLSAKVQSLSILDF